MPNILDKKINNQNFDLNSSASSLGANNTQTNSLNGSLDGGNQENTTQTETKGGLMANIAEFLPYAPLIFEKFTGQKIPAMTGTMADIEKSLTQLVINFQQVINNQNTIFNRIVNLETNANTHLVNLDKRFDNLQTLRLTHEKERKQIEFNPNKDLQSEENY